MNKEEYDQSLMDEIESQQQDESIESQEDGFLNQQEFQDAYGSPESEERQNQHSFLHKAAFDSSDTLKTTFLRPEECGRPDFSVRFLLQMKTISEHYLNEIVDEINDKEKTNIAKNKIAEYFWNKIQNVTNSGMSMDGFAMNLNVTKKMDATRRRVRDSSLQNLKGGKS